MRPPVRYWERKICMKPTCTRTTALFSIISTGNFRRRRYQMPHSRKSRQDKTISYTWYSSIGSDTQTNLENTLSGIYVCQPGNYTTPSSMKTRSRLTNRSYFKIYRRSTRREMGASYQGESNNMEWRQFIHYMLLGFKWWQTTRSRRQKQKNHICPTPPFTTRTQKIQVFWYEETRQNDYILNKTEYPRNVTVVQSLLLNYQHNYKSNI